METSVRNRRRWTRVSLSVPLLITSLDAGTRYSCPCDSIDVSSNGALVRVGAPPVVGMRVRLDILGGSGVTRAQVMRCERDGRRWKVSLQLLQHTGNFWKLVSPPKDWTPSKQEMPSDGVPIWYG